MHTTRIPRDFREFLKLLTAHEARFLVIGGYAVNAFGYVRNTIDLDLWIAADAVNKRRVILAVRDFAFPSAPDDLLDTPNTILRMGVPPLRIEVLQSISGVEFDECWGRRELLEAEDLTIPMISLADLKQQTGGWSP